MVSSKEIAKLAGVSQSTVSRVINNPISVKKDKRDRVEKIMKEMNYRPNSIARSLISNKTNQISLISGSLNSPFFAESTQMIVSYAREHGFNVNVYFEEHMHSEHLYETVFSQKADGIILSSMYYESEYFDELEALGVPYIMYNRRHIKGGNFVEMDNYDAGYQAIKYLHKHGHSNVLYLGGGHEKATFMDRYTGFMDGCKELGIRKEQIVYINFEEYDKDIGEIVRKMLEVEDKLTAIFATTDMIAIEVFDILKRMDLSVPEDIALISIDNTKMMQHSYFNLTSIGVETEETMAEIAIKELIDAIEHNRSVDYQRTIPSHVYERGTV